jgi:hypothetical protein
MTMHESRGAVSHRVSSHAAAMGIFFTTLHTSVAYGLPCTTLFRLVIISNEKVDYKASIAYRRCT